MSDLFESMNEDEINDLVQMQRYTSTSMSMPSQHDNSTSLLSCSDITDGSSSSVWSSSY